MDIFEDNKNMNEFQLLEARNLQKIDTSRL